MDQHGLAATAVGLSVTCALTIVDTYVDCVDNLQSLLLQASSIATSVARHSFHILPYRVIVITDDNGVE